MGCRPRSGFEWMGRSNAIRRESSGRIRNDLSRRLNILRSAPYEMIAGCGSRYLVLRVDSSNDFDFASALWAGEEVLAKTADGLPRQTSTRRHVHPRRIASEDFRQLEKTAEASQRSET
jgi:hypothetical protein